MTQTFYDLTAQQPKGDYPFSQLKGKVVLIVNTASACGFTPQYKGLEELYEKYRDAGLVVIGFPSNSFRQEKGNDDEVSTFCERFNVSFPLMKISPVNGADANEVFKWLKTQKGGILGITAIKWNFEKFLVDADGKVVERFGSTTKPEAIAPKIEKLLPSPKAKA